MTVRTVSSAIAVLAALPWASVALARDARSTAPGTILSTAGYEYRVAYESNASVDLGVLLQGQAAAATTSYRFAAALQANARFRIVEQGRDHAILLVRLTETALRVVINDADQIADCDRAIAAMHHGFLIRLDASGAVSDIRLGTGASDFTIDLVRGLVAGAQFVRSADSARGVDEWITEERDPAGVYRARYRSGPIIAGEMTVLKTKLAYLPESTSKDQRPIPGRRSGSKVIAPDTKVSIRFDRRTGLPTVFDGTETLTTTIDGQRVGSGTSRFQMILRRVAPVRPLASTDRAVIDALSSAAALPLFVVPDANAAEAGIQRRALGGTSRADLLVQLAAAGDDPVALDTLYLKVKALAYLDPAADVGLIDMLAKADPHSRRFEMVVRALAAVGDASAQAALSAVIRTRSDDADAVAALVPALAGMPSPTAEAEAVLRGLLTATDPMVVEQALLGLGGIARQLADGETARADAIVVTLIAQLGSLATEARIAAVLEALGNAGTPSIGAPVSAKLSDPVVVIRIAALHALRAVALPDVEAKLLHALTTDSDSRVRYAAAFALGFQNRSAATNRAEMAAFTIESDAYVRGVLLTNIAHAPDAMGAARQLIARAAERDTTQHVKDRARNLLATLAAPAIPTADPAP